MFGAVFFMVKGVSNKSTHRFEDEIPPLEEQEHTKRLKEKIGLNSLKASEDRANLARKPEAMKATRQRGKGSFRVALVSSCAAGLIACVVRYHSPAPIQLPDLAWMGAIMGNFFMCSWMHHEGLYQKRPTHAETKSLKTKEQQKESTTSVELKKLGKEAVKVILFIIGKLGYDSLLSHFYRSLTHEDVDAKDTWLIWWHLSNSALVWVAVQNVFP